MNDALANALEEKGIRSEYQRAQFAYAIGISERTLRRWLKREIESPHMRLQKTVARRLGKKPEDLWPRP